MEGLYLSNNQLSGAIPPQIGNLAALRSLNLSDNQLSGAIPPQIGNLTALQDLELHYNRLSGAIPSQIGNLTALTNLYLHSNQLSGAIPPEIGNLTALQGLYLLVNQLSGAIPPDIGDLTALRYLYLDSNQLSGAIPPQIGNLTALQRLSLYNNQLSGPIPSEIGSLAALRSLYLHNNPLSGEVPAAFTPLTLERLTFYDTNWCVPPTGAVPAWLGTIRSLYGTGLICGEELGSLSGVVSLASRTPASGVQVNLYRSLESDQWRHLDTVQTAGDGAYLFTDLGQGLGIDYRVQFEDPAQRLLSQYYDGQPTIQMATLIAITPGVPRTGIDAVLVEAKFVFLPLVLRQQ
ncbi:MAG: Internalin-A precursor [Chloroflexi bacterium ADurb.Bin360]|nr:MAG: Internalin-A precursor [Chloroflexi bacterium ADurb.Bin360]